MFNFIIHLVSATFVLLCVCLTTMGIVATATTEEWLKCGWGVAALLMSCWLLQRLTNECERIYNGLGRR